MVSDWTAFPKIPDQACIPKSSSLGIPDFSFPSLTIGNQNTDTFLQWAHLFALSTYQFNCWVCRQLPKSGTSGLPWWVLHFKERIG